MPGKVISRDRTEADKTALDEAAELGIPYGRMDTKSPKNLSSSAMEQEMHLAFVAWGPE